MKKNALFIGLVLSVCIFGLTKSSENINLSSSLSQESITIEPFSIVYQRVIKGVVGVQTMLGSNGSIGSGFIFCEDDDYHYIVTNQHVIRGMNEAYVRLHDARIIKSNIIGFDRALDVAVLSIEKQVDVAILEVGNSDYVNIGENVYAVGNPLSIMYHGHLTSGVISGINRLFTPVNDLDERQYLFQTDTPVNPGNSGGPLFNALGKVIGINSSKSIISYDDQQPAESISFAIPINDVMTVAKHIRTQGKFFPSSLGDNDVKDIKFMSNERKQELNIPVELTRGVHVKPNKESSLFYMVNAKAIIIKEVNGVEIIDAAHLRNQYYHKPAGYKLEIVIIKVTDNGVLEETLNVSTLAKTGRL